jgi:O-antigen ligase
VEHGAFFTFIISIVLLIHSVFFSQMIDVSVLKSIIWSMVAISIFLAFSKLSHTEMKELSTWLFRGSVILMTISWPLVIMPEGYLRNERGFQGILNHPQTWSVFMAFLCTWTTARILDARNPSWFLIVVLGSSISSLFFSQGRTGGLAFVLSISLAMMCMFLIARSGNVLRGLRSKQIVGPLLLIVLLLLLTTERWVPVVDAYVFKRAQYNASSFSDLYETSRGRLVNRALENFEKSPLTGVGFGIDVNREMEISREPIWGLPVSAPIEKGNAFVDALEEVGLIVYILLAAWLSYFFKRALRGGLVPLSIFLCSLLINLGEAVFFSPGGNGLLALLLFGWASYQAPRGKVGADD